MIVRGTMLAVAIAASVAAVAPASATMRISGDRGGQIGEYLRSFANLRASGENVVIDGDCLSACTLVLGIIPRARICATSRARLGFHAAWMPDNDGRPVTSNVGTRALWDVYPGALRHWISTHGGLSRKMIYLEGRALRAFVPSCETIEARAQMRSPQRTRTHHRLNYESASAANDRH